MTEVEKQLRDYNWIKRDIEESRKQIEVIRDTLATMRQLSAVQYDDMPKAKVIGSIVEDTATRIEQERINLKSWNDRLQEKHEKLMQINKWLDMLPDNQREIVIYRAIKDMRWNRVARACRYSEVRAKELFYKAINNIQREAAKT